MAVRLLQDLHANGKVFPKGTELDLDSVGVDQKSAIAEGLAEPINKVRTAEQEAELHGEMERLQRENAELRARLGEDVKTMDRKAKGNEPVKVETGTSRSKDNA